MNDEEQFGGTRLTLDLWHPGCWAIEATREAGGGVLAHAIYNAPQTNGGQPSSVTGLFTAFGEDEATVEALLDRISASDRAGGVHQLQERFGRARNAPGNVVREFFLEYDPSDMVCPTLLEHGFVHSAPVRIEDGREEWQVGFTGERSGIEASLDRVREESEAEVTVESITATDTRGRSPRNHRMDTLTAAQREAFEHARETGYYDWPRQKDTRELADDLGLSKTTLLEHLRRAESKLLNP